jgi:hypothetical protein
LQKRISAQELGFHVHKAPLFPYIGANSSGSSPKLEK